MATVSADRRPAGQQPPWQGLGGDHPGDASRPDPNVRPVTGKITNPHRVNTPVSTGRHAGPRTGPHTPPLPIGEARRQDPDAGPMVSTWPPTRDALPPIDTTQQQEQGSAARSGGQHASAARTRTLATPPQSSSQPRSGKGKEHAKRDSHRVELLEAHVKQTTSTTRALLEEALMAQSEIDNAWQKNARGEQDERMLLKQHIHSITQVVNKLSAELDSSENRWRAEIKSLSQGSMMQQYMLRHQVGSIVQASMATGIEALKGDLNRTTASVDTALREVQSNQGRFEQAIESLRRDVYGIQQKVETETAERATQQRRLETVVQESITAIRNDFHASLAETNLKLNTLEMHRLPTMCEHIYGQKVAGETEIPFAVEDKLARITRYMAETFEQERSARQSDRTQLEDAMHDVRADGTKHREELSAIIARMMQASSAHLQRAMEEHRRHADEAAIEVDKLPLLHATAGNDRVRKTEIAGYTKRAELVESKLDTLTALLYAKTDSLEKQIQAGSFLIYTQPSASGAGTPALRR